MKKFFVSIIAALSIFGATTSCSDMLEVESSRQVFDPEINQKTDSLFYMLGIMQAMQQLADQWVVQGEMRGDLVTTTTYTDNNLRQLANFTATTANKYDSAYVYYRVINNCNYFITHRDTTLLTGSTNVTIPEYVAAKVFRAWAYLQLVRNYGEVPYYTEPLTAISQIENSNFPSYDMEKMVDALVKDLVPYSGTSVPLQSTSYSIGSTNTGTAKYINLRKCYIPVDVMIGELCLEAGRYAEAANYYSKYLIDNKIISTSLLASYSVDDPENEPTDKYGILGSVRSTSEVASSWSSIFMSAASPVDVISYIPMAVNKLRGTTTMIPELFGYDYYATSSSDAELDEIQIQPSSRYYSIADSTSYYYYQTISSGLQQQNVTSAKLGDMRRSSSVTEGTGADSTRAWVRKYRLNGNILLYRESMVYLHLAEALNRLGYPDAAFGILKEGLNDHLVDTTTTYITDATRTLLSTTYPFFSDVNKTTFATSSSSYPAGIHQHGAGVVGDGYGGVYAAYYPGRSGYTLESELSRKITELGLIPAGTTLSASDSLQIRVDAMEDLICDEYALELAFEGRRFYDLMRLARHKNTSSPSIYGGNYGGAWLAKKLSFKNPTKDLSVEANWYLPYK